MVRPHIAILGAGISGLATAWYLRKIHGPQIKITLIEKENRVGGWIRTIHEGGFLFETGPHSCKSGIQAEETLRLIRGLDLQEQVVAADPAARNRYLYHRRQLRKIPQGLGALLYSPWCWPILPKLFKECFVSNQEIEKEETIAEFFNRRFGKYITDILADPMTSGIYAGDIHKLSLKSCFPILYEWERKKGSVVRGALRNRSLPHPDPWVQNIQSSGMFTLKGGLETLPKTIAARLDATIILQSQVLAIKPKGDRIEVVGSNTSLTADWLISALPAKALSPLLAPLSSGCSFLLDSIPYVSLAVVHLGYKQAVLKQKGFGHLIPSAEREEAVGVIWDSSAFSQLNKSPSETRLTILFKVPTENLSRPEDYLHSALKAADKHLGIGDKPDACASHIGYEALPQYTIGHADRMRRLEQEVSSISKRIKILGNSYWGPGINDCITKAKQVADSLRIDP